MLIPTKMPLSSPRSRDMYTSFNHVYENNRYDNTPTNPQHFDPNIIPLPIPHFLSLPFPPPSPPYFIYRDKQQPRLLNVDCSLADSITIHWHGMAYAIRGWLFIFPLGRTYEIIHKLLKLALNGPLNIGDTQSRSVQQTLRGYRT